LEFTFFQVREPTTTPYRLYVGDSIQITSSDPELNQSNITILPDGTISLRQIGIVRAAGQSIEQLSNELNERYREQGGVRNPQIVVQVLQADTPLRDIRDAVDARQGVGGQTKLANVTPDGTIQLPLINSAPALGLTLDELGREINARYRVHVRGLDVTARLVQPAPRYVYVMGEVNQPGRIEVNSPTTVMQAISQAGGWSQGGNIRQVIVFRRDQNWRLMAARLNLSGAMAGSRPLPSDEIWLRDSDIVLVPKTRIQRISELVDLYFTRTIYGVIPIQGYEFLFDGFSSVVD
jgi:polysaccharide export outer membrane protein